MNNTKDMVNHPSHYTQGNIECIDALKEATKDLKGIEAVCTANAIKYLWRWKFKNGVEDLKKAVWYTQRLIQELEENQEIEINAPEEWTGEESVICFNCIHFDEDETIDPNCICNQCKYTFVPGTPEYESHPLLYTPKIPK